MSYSEKNDCDIINYYFYGPEDGSREGIDYVKKKILTDVRYFEVKLFGYMNIQIGFNYSDDTFFLFKTFREVSSIAYSYLTGKINMDGKHYSTEANHNLYCDECVIGFGYNIVLSLINRRKADKALIN